RSSARVPTTRARTTSPPTGFGASWASFRSGRLKTRCGIWLTPSATAASPIPTTRGITMSGRCATGCPCRELEISKPPHSMNPTNPDAAPLTDREVLRTTGESLYGSMHLIRRVEEVIAEHYPEQEMRCPVHLCIGQEAIAAGICAQLEKTDVVFSS